MATATISRVEQLRSFREDLSRIDARVNSQFQEGLRIAQNLLELSDQQIADELGVSRPSVNRWMNGKNLPHNALRKVVVRWIDGQLAGRIRKNEATEVRKIENTGRSSVYSYSSSAAPARSLPIAAKGHE
jgi:hypothetical protein